MSIDEATPDDWNEFFLGRTVAEFPSTSKEPNETFDNVACPKHYNKGGVECIQGIKSSMTPEQYKGYLKGNAMKYLWRYEDKGKPVEDLRKCRVYLEWLIQEETKV